MQVSVIMPCHNAAHWIGAALSSVASQTRAPLEIIVIDDDSTDNSREVVEDTRPQLEKCGIAVVMLETKVHNAGAARNVGIKAARGDWIAFLDADDIWYSHHLENADALMKGTGAVAFMANHHFLSGQDISEIPPEMRARLEQASANLSHIDYVKMAQQGFHFGHSTVLIKRTRAIEVGLFDETQTRRHDIDLWLRALQDQTWAYHPIPAAQYRVDTPGSISKSMISCEYFYLRALLKNRAGYPHQAMEELLSDSARKLMSLSFVDGQNDDFKRACGIARPLLPVFYRLFYVGAALCRPAFQSAIRLKRAWVWRGHKTSTS
ncbi:MAG TPA: glycosyltransferase [Abditibacterium sp.]|jgi:glycosyltransferase involved in cell wall biosynthesis